MKKVGGAPAIKEVQEAEEGPTDMSKRTRLLRYETNVHYFIFYNYCFIWDKSVTNNWINMLFFLRILVWKPWIRPWRSWNANWTPQRRCTIRWDNWTKGCRNREHCWTVYLRAWRESGGSRDGLTARACWVGPWNSQETVDVIAA